MAEYGFLMLVTVVAGLASMTGAIIGAQVGRGMAIDARLEPLRAAIEELADRFIHATRRWNKRDRDAGESGGGDQRQMRLRSIAATVARRKAE